MSTPTNSSERSEDFSSEGEVPPSLGWIAHEWMRDYATRALSESLRNYVRASPLGISNASHVMLRGTIG